MTGATTGAMTSQAGPTGVPAAPIGAPVRIVSPAHGVEGRVGRRVRVGLRVRVARLASIDGRVQVGRVPMDLPARVGRRVGVGRVLLARQARVGPGGQLVHRKGELIGRPGRIVASAADRHPSAADRRPSAAVRRAQVGHGSRIVRPVAASNETSGVGRAIGPRGSPAASGAIGPRASRAGSGATARRSDAADRHHGHETPRRREPPSGARSVQPTSSWSPRKRS